MNKAVVVTIRGRVQGVFFRAETQKAAQGFGLAGHVKNMPDGSVQALFQGPQESVDRMLGWCKNGSPHSRVDEVTVVPIQPEAHLSGFEIQWH